MSASTGGVGFTNVLGNDTLNGGLLDPAMVSLTSVSSTSTGLTLSGSNVLVAPGTPAGVQVLTYRICELANTSNCDTAQATMAVIAATDLALTKSDSSFTYMPGASLSYTLSVRNLGPSPNAGFTVTDTLPAALIFASGAGCSAYGQVVSCTNRQGSAS